MSQWGGVSVKRVVDRSRAYVPEHAHDWPVLSLFVLGGYTNRTEIGETYIDAPSAILYRAGASHQNTISASGFEQIEVEFDPYWLGLGALPDVPVSCWLGGSSAAAVRHLARLCMEASAESQVRKGIRNFLRTARSTGTPHPAWVDEARLRLRETPSLRVNTLANEIGLHPSWLGTAFRRATGEGVLEFAARLRIERAAQMLRETGGTLVDIAIAAGFCDQSHMNRNFQALLQRSPTKVRKDRAVFRQANMPSPSAASHRPTPSPKGCGAQMSA